MIRQKNGVNNPSQAMMKEYHRNIQKQLLNNQSGQLDINEQFNQKMMEDANEYDDDEFEQDGQPAKVKGPRKKL